MNCKSSFLLVSLCLLFLNCKRKDEVFTTDPNARLVFSSTEVQYDTVYSDLVYPTRRIKIYNTNSQALALDEVSLGGGVSSPFRLLINGQNGPVVLGLELLGGDSMIVLVNLFFNAKNQSGIYELQDVIRFRFNGQEQQVMLKAKGEDALVVQPGDLSCAQVWNKQKAVILKGQTVVPAGCTLTIQKGTKLLASSGSSLDIKGTLLVTGDKVEPVYLGSVASGKAPGHWLGIRFYEGSVGNALSWFTLANATTGLTFSSQTSATDVDIALDHAVFVDFTEHALDLSFVSLTASNCLFTASANNLTAFSKQGTYSFRYCTWAGYSYDYYREGSCIKTSNSAGALSLSIDHSIVWGDKTEELDLAAATVAQIDTTIFRSSLVVVGTGQLKNQDPLFVRPSSRNFQLESTSPALNKGLPSLVVDDIIGVARDLTPDLGAYEHVP